MTVYYDPKEIYYDDSCQGPESDKAWMSVIDADLVEQILMYKAEQAASGINVLEWGSGRSTSYYSSLLANHSPASKWVSLEHNQQSFEEFCNENKAMFPASYQVTNCGNEETKNSFSLGCHRDTNIFVFSYGMLKDPVSSEVVDGAVIPEKYIQLPHDLGLKYDVVLVDGRFRRRCLIAAVDLLRDKGVVILHDAWREYYHCAFEKYAQHFRIGGRVMAWLTITLEFCEREK